MWVLYRAAVGLRVSTPDLRRMSFRMKFEPVSTVADLDTLDQEQISEGYRSAERGDPGARPKPRPLVLAWMAESHDRFWGVAWG
jgi:hypothetical protein